LPVAWAGDDFLSSASLVQNTPGMSKHELDSMIGQKILLIDNDIEFLKLTSRVFMKAGAQVITARNGMEGISKMLTHQPSLIILNVIMPRKDGLQLYQDIRQFSNTPLIMLSARDHEQLMLQGLEAGVDDILSKSINPEILLARARAVIRRSEHSDDHHAAFNYDDGRLEINVKKHRILIDGKPVKLTPVEFRLLLYLVSNADRVLSFDQILANVWGNEHEGNHSYVHVYISHLRSKIEQDAKSPRYILSIHAVGYLFEKQGMYSSFEKTFESLATG